MEEPGVYDTTIMDVLGVWPCARAIFEHVPARDLVRSERVSRRWQHAVHDYLHVTRNLQLYVGDFSYLDVSNHRTLEIEIDSPVLGMIAEKLGSYVVLLNTERDDAALLKIIESKCPHLHHIKLYDVDADSVIFKQIEYFKELKQVSLHDLNDNMTDLQLSRPFQHTEFEKIEIEGRQITGHFLKNIKYDNLKALSLNYCPRLDTNGFEHIACQLQNVTSLQLDHNGEAVLQNVHKMLTRMPRLESLSLRGYEPIQSPQKLIESFSRLSNLKRLDMEDNQNVNDELIEVVVRDCGKLEYLNITDADEGCVSSIAALYRRPPPAVTTLCLGYIQNCTSDDLKWYIESRFRYIEELEALEYVKLTPQWLEATARASQGRQHPLELRQACHCQPGVNVPLQELKIILLSTTTTFQNFLIGGITVDELNEYY